MSDIYEMYGMYEPPIPNPYSMHDTQQRLFIEPAPWPGDPLDEDQKAAAEPEERLTYVVGAAGSGKSQVLCERVARVVERATQNDPAQILVTAFNKNLIRQLYRWVLERLQASAQGLSITSQYEGESRLRGKYDDHGINEICVTNAYQANCKISFLNSDRLPTKIYLPYNYPKEDLYDILSAVDETSEDESRSEYVKRLASDTQFLDKELELIVFGRKRMTIDAYVDVKKTPRKGRKHPLRTEQRRELWPHLVRRANGQLGDNDRLYHVRRRMEMLNHYDDTLEQLAPLRLRPGKKFSHVFVDEAQDFTRTDLELLARTAQTPNRLFAAGDMTQAMHTAGISSRPRISGVQNWHVPKLIKNYRLPPNVASAMRPLAKKIQEDQLRISEESDGTYAVSPETDSSKFLGYPPIVIDGRNIAAACETVSQLSGWTSLAEDSPHWTVIAEPRAVSHAIANALRRRELTVDCESMLKSKGLEMSYVLLPTDSAPPFDEAAERWTYTALTRTTEILVIAVCAETSPKVGAALRLLDRDFLLFWGEQARDAWDEMCASVPAEEFEHEVAAYEAHPLTDDEMSISTIADWGPAEDWSDWHEWLDEAR